MTEAAAAASSPALNLRDVRLSANDLRALRADPSDAPDRPILAGVSLEVPVGGVFSLLGESGGGKTTLVKLLNRLVEAGAGQVEVLGKPVAAWSLEELRRSVVFVPQAPVLFGGTVRRELQQPLWWRSQVAKTAQLKEVLEVVLLGDLPLDRPSQELSGGQRGRLSIARALLCSPRVLILDEPSGSLDVRTARELLASLRTWVEGRSHTTLLCVTHRPEDLRHLGGQAAVLLEGSLHGPFPAEELAAGTVNDEAVRAFLGRLEQEEPA